MRLLPATQWATNPPSSKESAEANAAIISHSSNSQHDLEIILDGDMDINEESSPGNTMKSGASPFAAGKSFWMNLLEHRDERSSDDDNDDEYGRQEIESTSEIVTPINQDIENICLDNRGVTGCSLETDKTVLQKWETIIRSNGTDTTNETSALSSRAYTRRSLGGIKHRSDTPQSTNVHRSFGDVTNNFNAKSTGKGSHSVKKSLLTPPGNKKMEQSSRNITINRDDRCTSISPFGLRSCQGIKKIGPNQEDRNKFRRVYDTWRQAGLMNREINNNNNQNTVGKSSNLHSSTNISASSPIKEFGNDQQSFSEEESSSSMEILNMNIEEFGNDEQIYSEEESLSSKENLNTNTNRNNGQDLTSSGERELTGNDNVDSVSIKDSDNNGFNRLIGVWDHQSEDDTYHPSHIFSEGKLMKSSNDVTQDIIKEFEESTKGIISMNNVPLEEGSSPEYILSKDLRRNDIKEPVRALIILEQRNTCDVLVGQAQQNNIGGEDQLIIQNIVTVPENQDHTTQCAECECECTWSAFSGNDDLISFFLPQMGRACACGRQSAGPINPNDPTAIENILRPWQVEFLKSFDIHRGDQFVKARHRSGGIMAKALRQWRKKHDMVPFKTRSCATALQIWSKISKAYVRSIRKQELAGNKGFERESGTLIVNEMSQFLCELPAAPSNRLQQLPDIEPESQVEV
ncbi:MAG: hypothetical protein ACI8RD_003454 [Bacillariaceae sp.]|jgi:hypothetical protein